MRVTPSLFDKLTSGVQFDGGDDASGGERSGLPFFVAAQYERFNEQALRNSVKRELNWLFNTTQLGAATDLSPYPEVQRSVLNFGIPETTGKAGGRRVLQGNARDIREAIRTFEPRLDPRQLDVEVQDDTGRDNAVTYVVRSDITAAVQALPVQYKTEVDADTGAATVRD